MTGPLEYWVGKDSAFNGREIDRQRERQYSIPLTTYHSGLVKCNEWDSFLAISNVLRGIDGRKAEATIKSLRTGRRM
jgi:hypothetical protein